MPKMTITITDGETVVKLDSDGENGRRVTDLARHMLHSWGEGCYREANVPAFSRTVARAWAEFS